MIRSDRSSVTLIGIIALLMPHGLASAKEPRTTSKTINQRIVVNWTSPEELRFWREREDGIRELLAVNASTGKVSNVINEESSVGGKLLRGFPPASIVSSDDTSIVFVNETDQLVELFWIDLAGNLISYGNLAPTQRRKQHTFGGHCWAVIGESNRYYGSVVGGTPGMLAKIQQSYPMPELLSKRLQPKRQNTPKRKTTRRKHRLSEQSTQLSIRLKGSNLKNASGWHAVDHGLMKGHVIRDVSWSPDERVVACWKVLPAPAKEVFTLESSHAEGPRTKLHPQPYRLPGDAMDEFELQCFDTETGDRLLIDLPSVDFRSPKIRWLGDHQILVEKVDRGHQRFRLFRIDPLTASTQVIIDERTDTFLWTAHGPRVPLVKYLKESDQAIYSSERSGFRHLYLIDLNGDSSLRPLTLGNWVVREIIHLDEAKRTIDLLVSGIHPDQDPYHQHLLRIGLDGDHFQVITEADGDHELQFSPTREYVVATYSRADLPPVHELRRVSDGSQIAILAESKRLGPNPSSLPVRFEAKGRDGTTDIWGLIHLPDGFDANTTNHYPVIEFIYAGPHGSHVPKPYRDGKPFSDLLELGFVVVQIDGMGTANRSKAFHDVCWKNLKDAGFPDRIAWMKAAAEKYPAMDLSRVGIYGTSAGGQNACGALLFHGDFYKAAYASCGCHDNRMDKSSWNEQWMGYPVEEHYSQCSNIDQAHRLKGDLMLVVGELDRNVPPASTYRLVDALIKADKTFEFLMVPGMGHSDGGEYGKARMRDFFVRKLTP